MFDTSTFHDVLQNNDQLLAECLQNGCPPLSNKLICYHKVATTLTL